MPRVCNKDAPSRDLFVKSWIFMMLWLRLKPAIWLLHPSASAIEKIRIVFIDEPLTGFGLICDLLFAMAFVANCNFTIVYCFRVGFPKMKWAEENPQIMFDLEALFYPFYKSSTNSSLIMSLYKFHLRLSKPLILNHCLFNRFFILRICHYCQTFFCSRTSNIKQPSCS